MATTNQKILQAKKMAEVMNGINLHEPFLDFYGKNFDIYSEKEQLAS